MKRALMGSVATAALLPFLGTFTAIGWRPRR